MKTNSGFILTESPSLESPDEIKYAVFDDARFWTPKDYMKFEPFLPEGVSIVGPPKKGQNCFGFSLNDSYFNRWGFRKILDIGYDRIRDEETIRRGDVVAYCGLDPDMSGFLHSGVYQGDGMVRGRWGIDDKTRYGSPVIEHPLREILPTYYCDINGPWPFFYRKKE